MPTVKHKKSAKLRQEDNEQNSEGEQDDEKVPFADDEEEKTSQPEEEETRDRSDSYGDTGHSTDGIVAKSAWILPVKTAKDEQSVQYR